MQQEPSPPSPTAIQSFPENRRNTNRSLTSHYYTNIQGWLSEPSQELPSCSPYITLNKNTEKIIIKNYPPIPRNASENEPQATWLPLWQILPLTATGASQQDIRGIGNVK